LFFPLFVVVVAVVFRPLCFSSACLSSFLHEYGTRASLMDLWLGWRSCGMPTSLHASQLSTYHLVFQPKPFFLLKISYTQLTYRRMVVNRPFLKSNFSCRKSEWRLLLNLRGRETRSERLCGIVIRVPGYRSRGPGFDSRR
jgi:hypothetical protein